MLTWVQSVVATTTWRLARWWKSKPILSRRALRRRQDCTHKLRRLLMPAESSQWRPQSMNWDGYSTPHTDPKHLTDLGSGVVDGDGSTGNYGKCCRRWWCVCCMLLMMKWPYAWACLCNRNSNYVGDSPKRSVSRTITLLLIISWTSMFVMGVIDYRDESTLRSATVVYILRVLNESII